MTKRLTDNLTFVASKREWTTSVTAVSGISIHSNCIRMSTDHNSGNLLSKKD